jgi:hypothetical protein
MENLERWFHAAFFLYVPRFAGHRSFQTDDLNPEN